MGRTTVRKPCLQSCKSYKASLPDMRNPVESVADLTKAVASLYPVCDSVATRLRRLSRIVVFLVDCAFENPPSDMSGDKTFHCGFS